MNVYFLILPLSVLPQIRGSVQDGAICRSSADCQSNFVCEEAECGNKRCRCQEGYYPSMNNQLCLQVQKLGESCWNETACYGANAVCSDGKCVCRKRYTETSGGRCKYVSRGLELSLLGEACDNVGVICFSTGLQCQDGYCLCDSDLRNLTEEERMTHIYSPLECVPENYTFGYSVQFCPEPTTTVAPVSLLKKIFETCQGAETSCPANATCRLRGCDGRVCVCDKGFLPSTDYKDCVIASGLGDECGENYRCKDLYSTCGARGTCECLFGFLETSRDRCRQDTGLSNIKLSLLGESCDNGTCQNNFEQHCVNGLCACDGSRGFRMATDEDRMLEPFSIMDCRPTNYIIGSVNKTCIASNTVKIEIQCSGILDRCPNNADCESNLCGVKRCRCRRGFAPKLDYTECLPIVHLGGNCNSSLHICFGPHSLCSEGKCKCKRTHRKSDDGNWCVINQYVAYKILNESCSTDIMCGRASTQECRKGICQCRTEYRPATKNETLDHHGVIFQCVRDNLPPDGRPPALCRPGETEPVVSITGVGEAGVTSEGSGNLNDVLLPVLLAVGSLAIVAILVALFRRRKSLQQELLGSKAPTCQNRQEGAETTNDTTNGIQQVHFNRCFAWSSEHSRHLSLPNRIPS